jgi:hypothetical protein
MVRNGKFWTAIRRDEEYNVIVDIYHDWVFNEDKEYPPIYSEMLNVNIEFCGWSGVPTGIEEDVLRSFLSE